MNWKLKIVLGTALFSTIALFLVSRRNEESSTLPLASLFGSTNQTADTTTPNDSPQNLKTDDASLAIVDMNAAETLVEDESAHPSWIRHKSEKYKFSFEHPEDLSVASAGAGGGVVFTVGGRDKKGFQIFVLPHDEPTITGERIQLDLPDMPMENINTGTLDGADAIIFNSQDESLGETYEVWFVRGGFLFQITSFASFAKEMNSILETWRFIQ